MHNLTWRQLPAQGAVVALLVRDEHVYGWVIAKGRQVWTAYEAPVMSRAGVRVNVFTDGVFVGAYPEVEQAMAGVMVGAIRLVEQRLARAARVSGGTYK